MTDKTKNVLETRLKEIVDKKYRTNEMYNIIKDFILNPLIGEFIETSNKIHEVMASRQGYNITKLTVIREKSRYSGIFGVLQNLFGRWEKILTIRLVERCRPANQNQKSGLYSNGIFICEYYSYSSLVDTVKDLYYEKLYSSFGCEFVLVSRT